jgi:hypothetical protein
LELWSRFIKEKKWNETKNAHETKTKLKEELNEADAGMDPAANEATSSLKDKDLI